MLIFKMYFYLLLLNLYFSVRHYKFIKNIILILNKQNLIIKPV